METQTRKMTFEEILAMCNEIREIELRSEYLRKILQDQKFVSSENAFFATYTLIAMNKLR